MAPRWSPVSSHAADPGGPSRVLDLRAGLGPRSRRLPRHVVYPLVGLLLSAAAPAGLLVLRLAVGGHPPTAAWLGSELRTDALAYGYIASFTLALLLILGLRLGRKEDRLRETSITDPLTGLANRRHLQSRLGEELERSRRYGVPLSLLLIDVDHLKQVNDRCGHRAGDVVLRFVAGNLRRSCRSTDLAARWGGDEFAVVAPSTNAAAALVLANGIRELLHRRLHVDDGDLPSLSVSIGVADVELAGSCRAEALTEAADRALYRAKLAGRDRAVLAASASARPEPAPRSPPEGPGPAPAPAAGSPVPAGSRWSA